MYLVSAVMAVGFTLVWRWFDMDARVNEIYTDTIDAVDIVADSQMSDKQKEQQLQTQSKVLFQSAGSVIGISVIAILLPLGVIWVLSRLGLFTLDRVMAFVQTIRFWLSTIFVGFFAYYLLVS